MSDCGIEWRRNRFKFKFHHRLKSKRRRIIRVYGTFTQFSHTHKHTHYNSHCSHTIIYVHNYHHYPKILWYLEAKKNVVICCLWMILNSPIMYNEFNYRHPNYLWLINYFINIQHNKTFTIIMIQMSSKLTICDYLFAINMQMKSTIVWNVNENRIIKHIFGNAIPMWMMDKFPEYVISEYQMNWRINDEHVNGIKIPPVLGNESTNQLFVRHHYLCHKTKNRNIWSKTKLLCACVCGRWTVDGGCLMFT